MALVWNSQLLLTGSGEIGVGLESYTEAFRKEFYRQRGRRTYELRSISIRERGKNNRVERLHNTLKDRTKTQRALDNDASAQVMVDGIRLAYNFTRPHMALGGLTPAQAAGLDLQLNGNRWKQLIQRSATTEQPKKSASYRTEPAVFGFKRA